MSSPLSPATVKRRLPDALPPYLSNGVLGIRFPGVPYMTGTTMVNGFAGIHPNDGVEGFARAPFVLATDVQLGGVWASAAPEWIRVIEQRYDFATAELHTAWTFRVDGTTATVETTAFCSRTVPALAACDVQVRVDGPADVALAAGIDPTGVPGFATDGRTAPGPGAERGRRRAPSLALIGRHLDGRAWPIRRRSTETRKRSERPSSRDERGWFSTTYRVRARTDRRYGISLLTAVVPVLSHARPDEQAGRLAAVGAKRGFDALRQENAAAWRELWRGRIEIDGADLAGRRSPTPACSTS